MIAVTGATGFVGWHVAEALGEDVRAIVRPGNRKPLPPGVASVEAALADTSALARALDGCEAVVHAAGVIRARTQADFDAVNVDGTRTVVAAANAAGARVILISSEAAIGAGTPERPSREDDPPRPLTPYGRSKLAGEQVARQDARLPWTIIRPSAVYGPRDHGFLPLFALAARGLFPLIVRPEMPFTFVHVHDLARAIALAARANALTGADVGQGGSIYFVTHPDPFTGEELFRTLADIFGKRYRAIRIPGVALTALAGLGAASWAVGIKPIIDRSRLVELRADGFVCSVDRIRDALGFKPALPLRAGLEATAAWYRAAGWI